MGSNSQSNLRADTLSVANKGARNQSQTQCPDQPALSEESSTEVLTRTQCLTQSCFFSMLPPRSPLWVRARPPGTPG